MVRKIFILLIFIVSVPWSALASTSVLRYEGELSGGALSTSTLTNQQFEATIRRPDSCGGDLITPSWTSSIVTITNGKFVISPTFNSATLAQVMNPNNNFGAGCISNPARNLVIRWNSGTWETFNVSITDSPRAALAAEALNASAIGGKPVQATLTCNANEFLKYDGAKFVCVPIAVIDIPVMDATKITSGTFSTGLIPSFAGDVTGTIGANSVTKLVGRALDTATPANGQVLTWNNVTLKWEAQTPASYTLPNIVTGATTVNTGTSIPVITYDNQGRITNASAVALNDSTKLALSGGTLSGALQVSTATADTTMILQNSATGGRSYMLSSTGDLSAYGGGRFVISDGTGSIHRMAINQQGYVGIASVNPRAHLDVSGTILPASSVANGTATVNFLNGNLQHTGLSCQPFALHNLKSGGTYTFIVKGATAATCTFTAFSDAGVTALILHAPPSMISNASTHTIFNFLVSDTDIYVTFANGL